MVFLRVLSAKCCGLWGGSGIDLCPGAACARAQTAKHHLEKALAIAQKEGCSVTEGEIAEHHYKLGRILWTMGGNLRDDPTQARAHFEAASREECDSQARAPLVTGVPAALSAERMCVGSVSAAST